MTLAALAGTPCRAADVTVSVYDSVGVYHVHGAFEVPVPVSVAWAVLVDYEHIPSFVRSVRTSKFVLLPAGERVLSQDVRISVFPFHRSVHVELVLQQEHLRRIQFRDVASRDFHTYRGEWTLRHDNGLTVVEYELEADPASRVPHLIGRGVLSNSSRDLLGEVRTEMLRRVNVQALGNRLYSQ